jgi:microcystin-dependent protein
MAQWNIVVQATDTAAEMETSDPEGQLNISLDPLALYVFKDSSWQAVATQAGAPPAATETAPGVIELATSAETITGTDTARAVHPAGLAAALAAFAAAQATQPTGMVTEYAGAAAPTGWLLCDGSAVSRTTYSALYTALGGASSPWGQGDGSTTFNVPDMRGRAAIGAGQGSGLTNRALAAQVGTETHTLTTTEMPAHTHGLSNMGEINNTDAGGAQNRVTATGTGLADTTDSAGGGTAHSNMQPSVAINYIIKT